jgi:hypothetical protein
MSSPSAEADPQRLAFTWDWTRAEHIRLHKALFREASRRGPIRIARAAFYFVIGAVVLVLLFNAFWGDLQPLARTFPWLLMVGGWVVLFTWMLPRSSARSYLKAHRGPLRLVLTPDAVESGCDVCSSQVRWSAIERAVETPEFFSCSTTASAPTSSPSGSCRRWRSRIGCVPRSARTSPSRRPSPPTPLAPCSEPVARHEASPAPRPLVREGGLRVVVAANSFALP